MRQNLEKEKKLRKRGLPIADVAEKRTRNCLCLAVGANRSRAHTFIEDEQLAPAYDSTRQRQDLSLANGKVTAATRDRAVQGETTLVVTALQRK